MQLPIAVHGQNRQSCVSFCSTGTHAPRLLVRPRALVPGHGSGAGQQSSGSPASPPASAAAQQKRGPNAAAPPVQSQEATVSPTSNRNSSSSSSQQDSMQRLLHLAADQRVEAEATTSSLRDMIQTMVRAQELLRRWRVGFGTVADTATTTTSLSSGPSSSSSNNTGRMSPSKSDQSSPSSGRASPGGRPRSPSPSRNSAAIAAGDASAAQQGSQPELYATKAKLSRALNALTKLQAAYQQQQTTIRGLEEQLQQIAAAQPSTDAAPAADTGSHEVAADVTQRPGTMPPSLAAALAMAAGAGAASTQLSEQQQELRAQLAAAEQIERELNNELHAKQEQMQKLKQQVAVELAELRGVITQQAAQLSQLSRLLLDSQAQLADSKEAEAQTQKQLHHREAELTAKVAELSDLADALSAAQDAASGMRWELLSKEAALSTLTKQLADAEETAQRAAAAQADLLQQKEATIAALLEKLELQEAAAAAEEAWAADQLQDSNSNVQQLQEQLQQLQEQLQQQQRAAEQAQQQLQTQLQGSTASVEQLQDQLSNFQQQLQQQQAAAELARQELQELRQQQHAPAEGEEVPLSVVAKIRRVVLSSLMQQLQSMQHIHRELPAALLASKQQAEPRDTQTMGTTAAGAAADAGRAATGVHNRSNDTDDGASAELVEDLQKLVDNNEHLADQLVAVLGALAVHSQQHAADVAAKDGQLEKQAGQLEEAGKKLDQQAELLAAAVDAAAVAAKQQQEEKLQLQQQLQRQREQQQPAQPVEQRLVVLESAVSSAMQELQDALCELHTEGAWAFPTSHGLVDLSVPRMVQEYQQLLKAHLQDGLVQVQLMNGSRSSSLSREEELTQAMQRQARQLDQFKRWQHQEQQQLGQKAGHKDGRVTPVSSNDDIGSGYSTSGSGRAAYQAPSLAAADAFVDAYFQVQDRDQALHSVAAQLVTIQRQLVELLAIQRSTAEQQPGTHTASSSEGAVSSSTQKLPVPNVAAALRQTEARLEQVKEMNIQLSESLSVARQERAAAEAELAVARHQVERLAQQLEEAQAATAASVKSEFEQLQRDLTAAKAQLCEKEQQLQIKGLEVRQVAEGQAAVISGLQQQLQATAAAEAELLEQNAELEGQLAVARVRYETAASEKTHLQQQLAAATESPQGMAHLDAYQQQLADNLSVQQEQRQAQVEMRRLARELERVQSSEKALQQQLQKLQQQQLQQVASETVENVEASDVKVDSSLASSSIDLAAGSAAASANSSSSDDSRDFDGDFVQEITINVGGIIMNVQEQPLQAADSAANTGAVTPPAAAAAPQPHIDAAPAVDVQTAHAAAGTSVASTSSTLIDVSGLPLARQKSPELLEALQLLKQVKQQVESRDATIAQLQQRVTTGRAVRNQQQQQQATPETTAKQQTPAVLAAAGDEDLAGEVTAAEAVQPVNASALAVLDIVEPAEQAPSVSGVAATPVVEAAAAAPVAAAAPAPATIAKAAAAAANAGMGSSSSRAELVGSGLSMALLVPLVSQLQKAQQSEAQLLAAKNKVCQVLGLLAGTEAALVQTNSQVLALQQRLWEVVGWRPLLAVAWQLQEAEEWLAAEMATLQQLDEQQLQQQEQQAVQIAAVKQRLADVQAGDVGAAGTSCSSTGSSGSRVVAAAATSQYHERFESWCARVSLQGTMDEEDKEQATVKAAAFAPEQQQEQQQKQQQDHECSALIAGFLGWHGPKAASAAVEKARDKVGSMLQQLAERQGELARLQWHVQRLAAILMAGVDDQVLAQLQGQLEGQLQQVEKSRMSVRQQLHEMQQLAASAAE